MNCSEKECTNCNACGPDNIRLVTGEEKVKQKFKVEKIYDPCTKDALIRLTWRRLQVSAEMQLSFWNLIPGITVGFDPHEKWRLEHLSFSFLCFSVGLSIFSKSTDTFYWSQQ